jgi:hypothetical protein
MLDPVHVHDSFPVFVDDDDDDDVVVVAFV